MGHHPVAVDELEDGARDERAEDRLDAEPVGQDDEAGQEQECASHSDLGRRVLQPAQRVGQPPRAARADERERNRRGEEDEPAEQDRARGRAARLRGEEEREQDDGRDVRDRRPRQHGLPES